jgi:pimeloyl-ACP methyl ester carboxylesterase
MFATINTLKVHYHVSGAGHDLLLLHGWGTDLTAFTPVHSHLETSFRVYSLDFPGFGQSDPPPSVWGTQEYADFVRQFLKEFHMTNPILIGHSFGGRISIRLASTESIPKVILVDSAGIRPRRSWTYYLKVSFYKSMKAVVTTLPIVKDHAEQILERFRRTSGSTDYQQTSGVMRGTFIKVVNEDLRHLLPKILAPTLLIWGENDEATPVADGSCRREIDGAAYP